MKWIFRDRKRKKGVASPLKVSGLTVFIIIVGVVANETITLHKKPKLKKRGSEQMKRRLFSRNDVCVQAMVYQ